MQTLKEVEAAKALMREAVNWSVMHWLAEKKRVRKAADVANDALDALDRKVKDGWSTALKAAYAELAKNGQATRNGTSEEIWQLAKCIREADEKAWNAHMDAENTFDVAEKRLSTSMAREGTHKAIESWVLHEEAIALSESAITKAKLA